MTDTTGNAERVGCKCPCEDTFAGSDLAANLHRLTHRRAACAALFEITRAQADGEIVDGSELYEAARHLSHLDISNSVLGNVWSRGLTMAHGCGHHEGWNGRCPRCPRAKAEAFENLTNDAAYYFRSLGWWARDRGLRPRGVVRTRTGETRRPRGSRLGAFARVELRGARFGEFVNLAPARLPAVGCAPHAPASVAETRRTRDPFQGPGPSLDPGCPLLFPRYFFRLRPRG